ncbi:hypothetical protein Taro_047346 [Colocasia esculenta]|uniref:Uncharacterized protein n=1 Tax=Colocasia esculenta TaxID=4460 RepID=A0A843X0P0_COLES|nr:hypothetical protein [Colocasia esculenta]
MEEDEAAVAMATADAPRDLPRSFSTYPFTPPEVSVFRDEDEDEDGEEDEYEARHGNPVKSPSTDQDDSSSSSSSDGECRGGGTSLAIPSAAADWPFVDPEPHVSAQFHTFNRESHALMAQCILEGRLPTPGEIRRATPAAVLSSWRSVWKDRNEDTAYLTAWKRIQDKLGARHGPDGALLLYFKNNRVQCVSHVEQWQGIVAASHADADLRHLGLKDTIDRIKHVWTVGSRFYGIPESFIRACVASCPVCSGEGPAADAAGRSKRRRRFEYTESFDVPARDVPARLQQLAAKHKVVLCIRQKYIRFKPFMAEVKDYACHRAGEPTSSSSTAGGKKSRVLKREPYASKRCGCGFRIRAIVPITNYNEKDKTFIYDEEGTAVFKLYAVHTGHEPGPLDGNARIIHRVLGHKGGFDQDAVVYGVSEEAEPESYISLLQKDEGDELQQSVLRQVRELRVEISLLEGKVMQMPRELLGLLSQELSDILHIIRNPHGGAFLEKAQHPEEVLMVGDGEFVRWGDDHQSGHNGIYDKDVELMEEDAMIGQTLGSLLPWDRMRDECESSNVVMKSSCKPDRWLLKEDSVEFDEKSILFPSEEEDLKMIKPIRNDGDLVADPNIVGISVDGFYPENAKWYDSPCGLDPRTDCGDGSFRHGGIV